MKKKQYLEIGLVFLLMVAAAIYVDCTDGQVNDAGVIEREGVGGRKKDIELTLSADDVCEKYPYTLTVEPVKVTEQEAKSLMEQAKKEIEDSFVKEGQTTDYVTECVNMKTSYVSGTVSAEWFFSDYKNIDTEGNILEDHLDEKGAIIVAKVELTCGAYKELYEFPFIIYPRKRNQVEQLISDIDDYIEMQQSKEGKEDIQLPDCISGIPLSWSQKKEYLALKILLLEGLVILFFPLVRRSRKKEADKKRREAFMLDYPEMVSKINVLVGAGMTIKQAWHTISARYINNREKNAIPEIQLFEEMVKTEREIRDGKSERIAYQNFGDRIGIPEYHRFVRLIVSNLQKGNRGLCELLEQESEKAFAERRLLARRLGEEAGTKLLFPMMMMLGIVMAIVIVPALSNFTM